MLKRLIASDFSLKKAGQLLLTSLVFVASWRGTWEPEFALARDQSCFRELNSGPHPYQGCALPLS